MYAVLKDHGPRVGIRRACYFCFGLRDFKARLADNLMTGAILLFQFRHCRRRSVVRADRNVIVACFLVSVRFTLEAEIE